MNSRKVILFAIVFIPLVLIIPINVMLIHDARERIENAERAIIEDNESLLQIYAETIESKIQQVDSYIKILTEEKYPYLKLAEKDFYSFNSDFREVQNQLIAEFEYFLAINDAVSSITAYFNASELYINRDRLSKNDKIETIEKLKLALKDSVGWEQQSLGNQWRYLEIEQDAYLVKMYEGETSRCMITISMDGMLYDLKREGDLDNYKYYFGIQGDKVKEKESTIFELESVINNNSFWIYKDRFKYYNSTVRLQYLDLYLGGLMLQEDLSERIPRTTHILLIFSIISCCVGPIISFLFFALIENPLRLLNKGMKEVSKGNTNYRIPIKEKMFRTEFDDLNVHFNTMLEELEQTKLQVYQEKINRQKIQLRYLNQQIRPHFILNTLNQIYMFDDDEFPAAKKVIIYLTKYFRYLVNLKSDYVLLWEEMEHTDNYLNIQKARYPKRFMHFVEWEEELKLAKIPAVVIQTFVENSIKHGFEKGSSIFIFVLVKKIENDRIQILIADTGKGFKEEYLKKVQQFLNTRKYDKSLGIGIQNVVNRLMILYGEEFDIKIYNASNGGVRVVLEMPFIVEKGEDIL